MISQKETPPFPAWIAPTLRQWYVSAAAGCCVMLVLLFLYLFLSGRDSSSLLLAFRTGPPRDCDPLQLSPFATPCPAAPSPPQPYRAHENPLCCANTDPSPAEPANVTLWRAQLRGVVLALLYNRAPHVNASVIAKKDITKNLRSQIHTSKIAIT
ncbi:unnamed protein product [Closterium sp. Naga37s-1]|nr:unnamed protein product [Closterium sp. Naga37s-1]